MIGKPHEWRYEHGDRPLRAFFQELHMAEHRLKKMDFKVREFIVAQNAQWQRTTTANNHDDNIHLRHVSPSLFI